MEELKKEYNQLKKKYNLPDFEQMDEEFEIRAIEMYRSGILIKALLRAINNKLSIFMNYLESIVNGQPQHIHALIEIKNTTDSEKEEMYEHYKKISILLHENLVFDLKPEKEIAKQINKNWKEWKAIKEKEIKLLEIITDAWRRKEESPSRSEYAG